MSKPPVYLIDGSGYIFRAYYAVPNLTTSKGFPTGGLFAFTKMLINLLKELKSPYVSVAFDFGKQTFRNELYKEYKQNRVAAPDALVAQMPFFRDIVRALGLPLVEKQGYEADDLIGTLTKRLNTFGHPVTIISGDKDFMQLVSPETSIYEPMNKKHIQRNEVIAKFGVPPEQVRDVLALMGDSSDNIPGASGVGPKTAAQLIQKFGSVEKLLECLNDVEGCSEIRGRQKVAATLAAEIEIVRVSKDLVTIRTDSPMDFGGYEVNVHKESDEQILAWLQRKDFDYDALGELASRFEFETLFEGLSLSRPVVAEVKPEVETGYRLIDESGYAELLNKLQSAGNTAFDLETSSLDPLSAKIIGLSFCCSEEEAFYVSMGGPDQDQAARWRYFIGLFRPWFEDADKKKMGQNAKFDIKMLAQHGVTVRGVVFDSMLAAYLIAPDAGTYNLTVLAREYLGRSTIEFDEVTSGTMDFSTVPLDKATQYACQDAHYVFLLEQELRPKLEERDLMRVLNEIEIPLISVLAKMELAGIMVDTGFLSNLSKEFGAKLEVIQAEIYQLAGGNFNINSPKQLQEILFGKLALSTKGLKKTKTGISTDQSVLEKLAEQHVLPAKILAYRMLFKLKSTYIDALPQTISPVTNRLHTTFNQAVAATGRLSSSDPNLQNIPIQSEEGRRIRESFIAPPGKTLISADYSQIELRLLAHLSGDKAMKEAFQQNADIHSQTARELFQIPPLLKPTAEQRRLGKTINFGIVYGMGPYRLARDLEISFKEASNYIERYFQLFSGVKQYFDGLQRDAQKVGYVTTMFGRRRVLDDLQGEGGDQSFVQRVAMNAPIQGSAADLIKLAMIALQHLIEEQSLPMRILLQIHDELVVEADLSHAEAMAAIVRSTMEGVISISVPLLVEAGIGHTWGGAHG